MNVLVTGAGPENAVLLPGFGTSLPVLDFGPLEVWGFVPRIRNDGPDVVIALRRAA